MRAVAAGSALVVLLLLAVHTLTTREAPVRAHATATAWRRPSGGGDPADLDGVVSGRSTAAAGAPNDLQLWHVTDWHLNLYHDARGDVVNMCRSRTADASRWPGAAGHWNCDPSLALAAAAVARMAAIGPAPAAILLGGDSFGHVPPSRDGLDAVLASHTAMHALLTTAFPRTPVLPVLGNHDTWPYFSHDRRAARHLARLWGAGLSPDAAAGLAERGYYTHILRVSGLGSALRGPPSLTLVCLDTNALSLPETGDGTSDGSGGGGGRASVTSARAQLQWLESTLGRLPNRSALILGHIPPGASHVDYDSMAAAGWQGGGLQAWPQRRLYAVLARHSRAVAALIFGHLHTPSIRLLPRGRAQQQKGGLQLGKEGAQQQNGGFQKQSGGLQQPNWGAQQQNGSSVPSQQQNGLSMPAQQQKGGLMTAPQQNEGPMPVAYVSPSLTMRNPTPHVGGVRRYTLRAEGGAKLASKYGARGGAGSRRRSGESTSGNVGFVDVLVGSGGSGAVRAGAPGSPGLATGQHVAAPFTGAFIVEDMLDLLLDLPHSAAHSAILGRDLPATTLGRGGAAPHTYEALEGATAQAGGAGAAGAPWLGLGAAAKLAAAAAAAAMAAVSRGAEPSPFPEGEDPSAGSRGAEVSPFSWDEDHSAVSRGAERRDAASAEDTSTTSATPQALGSEAARSVEKMRNSVAAAEAQLVALPSWRVVPSVRTEMGLPSLSESSWRAWLNRLRMDDGYFSAQMPPQRCADEIEPNYAKCKAAVVCAVSEGEPAAYAACLRQVRASAVAPEACRVPARKREPP